jgi:hypothetical protein
MSSDEFTISELAGGVVHLSTDCDVIREEWFACFPSSRNAATCAVHSGNEGGREAAQM